MFSQLLRQLLLCEPHFEKHFKSISTGRLPPGLLFPIEQEEIRASLGIQGKPKWGNHPGWRHLDIKRSLGGLWGDSWREFEAMLEGDPHFSSTCLRSTGVYIVGSARSSAACARRDSPSLPTCRNTTLYILGSDPTSAR